MSKNPQRFVMDFTVMQSGIMLRDYIHEQDISKRTLTAIKYEGGLITVNGEECDVRWVLQKGDQVQIMLPMEKPSAGLIAQEGELSIVFEDDALLIVDKPAGKSSIPSRDHPDGTISNFVAGKFAQEGLPATVHIVTRLDRNTSGLVCIAKNRHIHHLLSRQLIAGTFNKQYKAIAQGYIESGHILIEQPIGRKHDSIIERIVCDDGKYAKTEVNVLHTFEYNHQPFSLVTIKLHTGRTHQIRVHMSWINHSLAGDDLYGGSMDCITRQALHCSQLEFIHPLTGKPFSVSSELPADMQLLIPNYSAGK